MEVDNNLPLFDILKIKEDCWNMEIVNSTRFEPEIGELRQLDIKVGQVLNLYERLGGDSSLLGEAIKKQVKEAEEEENNKQSKKPNDNKKKKTKKQVF